MTTAPNTKAVANEHGVTWATSKSGKLRIAVGAPSPHRAGGWAVWAIVAGTHDMALGTQRNFGDDEAAARKFANVCWRTR